MIVAFIYALFAGQLAAPVPSDNANARAAADDADRAVAEAGIDPAHRRAMEAVIRDYLLENPEVLSEAIAVLQQREAKKRLTGVRDKALAPFPGAVGGNPAGRIVLVEFTDYACGYCRASHPEVERLIRDHPQVKVVYREVPVIAEISKDAALMGLAAARQGKYKAYHDAMFTGPPASRAAIDAAARRAGLDMAAARAFTASPEAARELDANVEMMRELRLGGTPSFILGDELFEGAVGYDKLAEAVKRAG